MRAVLLVSHGSRSPELMREIRQIVRRLRRKAPREIWGYAFLEQGRPALADGIRRCVRQGVTEIVLLLNFLNSGRHVDEDIQRLVREARCQYPFLRLRVTPPLIRHPRIADILFDMLRE